MKEWHDMGTLEHINEIVLAVFGTLIFGPVFGLLIAGGLAYTFNSDSVGMWGVIGAVGLTSWNAYARFKEVGDSKQRTMERCAAARLK